MSHETEKITSGLHLTAEQMKKLKIILSHEKVDKLIDYKSSEEEE